MKFSFGSDPELMLVRNGQYRSAIGIVKGSIENRIKIQGHEFYYDNVLAECAIKPSFSKEEVVPNFKECLQLYAKMVAPFQLVLQSAHHYDRAELHHPDAKKVNCAPEYCPYEMKKANGPIEEILYGTLRTCGGHIHLGEEGLTEGHFGVLAMYMMDLFVGIPSLWLDKDPTSSIRREMYGAAGRYRAKKYGMEYRSLSNFWLGTPRLVEFIYDMSEFVTNFVISGEADKHWNFDIDVFYNSDNLADAWTCLTYDKDVVIQSIKTGDKQKALSVFEFAQSLMPAKLKKELIELCDKPTEDFYSAWGINGN